MKFGDNDSMLVDCTGLMGCGRPNLFSYCHKNSSIQSTRSLPNKQNKMEYPITAAATVLSLVEYSVLQANVGKVCLDDIYDFLTTIRQEKNLT